MTSGNYSQALALAVNKFKSGLSAEAESILRGLGGTGQADPRVKHLLAAAISAQGRHAEAIPVYQDALRLQPGDAALLCDLGVALLMTRAHEEAADTFKRIIARHPGHLSSRYNLALSLIELKDWGGAEEHLVYAIKLAPANAELFCSQGYVLLNQDRITEAETSLRKALALTPDHVGAHYNLGMVLDALFRFAESERHFERALELKPDFADAARSLGNARIVQGKCESAITAYRHALSIDKTHRSAHSNLLLSMHYTDTCSPEEIFQEHRLWADIHATAKPLPQREMHELSGSHPVRVGLVSADFRAHSVSYFLRAVFDHYDRESMHLYCYSDVKQQDAVSDYLKARAVVWRDVRSMAHEQLAHQIHDDRVDVLVDLAGHTGGGRLQMFAYRPAPVQVSWLGYPDTTGMSAMDYRITDSIADPESVDRLHSEKLIRLSEGFLCYTAADGCPDVSQAPSATHGCITFGSFNTLPKLSDATLDAWAGILGRLPTSRLFIKSKALLDKETMENLAKRLSVRGFDMGRVRLSGWALTPKEHLAQYSQVDIALDTFPYNGTTTTCEALWMGVPVITIAGDRHCSRVGYSLLSRIGRECWVAKDVGEYIELAVRLAEDRDALYKARSSQRNQMANSVLCDGRRFAREFESVICRLSRRQGAMP